MNEEHAQRKEKDAKDFESRTLELILCVFDLAYERDGLDGFAAQLAALYRTMENVAAHPEQRVAAMRHYLSTLSPDIMQRFEQSGQLLQFGGVSAKDAQAWLANPEAFERRVALLLALPEDATRH